MTGDLEAEVSQVMNPHIENSAIFDETQLTLVWEQESCCHMNTLHTPTHFVFCTSCYISGALYFFLNQGG